MSAIAHSIKIRQRFELVAEGNYTPAQLLHESLTNFWTSLTVLRFQPTYRLVLPIRTVSCHQYFYSATIQRVIVHRYGSHGVND